MTDQPTEDDVVIEFIDAADVPDEHKKDNKVFTGGRAVVMWSRAEPTGTRLYFTEAEWEAFIGGVKDGEFDDLLEEPAGT